MNIVINILHIIVSVSIIAIVLLQSGRSAGISRAIAGGLKHFGKHKVTIDAKLVNTQALQQFCSFTSIILTLLLK